MVAIITIFMLLKHSIKIECVDFRAIIVTVRLKYQTNNLSYLF